MQKIEGKKWTIWILLAEMVGYAMWSLYSVISHQQQQRVCETETIHHQLKREFCPNVMK